MAAEVGSKAPDFTLTNQDRQPVTLSAERGHPVVLAFFPAAFSSVCQKELCTFRDSMGQLNSAKAHVFGISVDTFFALKAFYDQQHFTFPLLSDWGGDVTKQYGLYNPKYKAARRINYLIDKEGKVVEMQIDNEAIDPAKIVTLCERRKSEK